ncbi:hypothetical protein J437_LFUL017964 [Ladona fulva]|uniref:HIT-type domain-containing protein n=1 Tax=Ladona fulva TaxID=123851 RepID=A0A8K0KT48_LADFU|nr:hypothetical protein J437_LFUL017964 [Ladona fulva]
MRLSERMIETEDDTSKTCVFCKIKHGKYVCPRCHVIYCSVPCYQAKEHLECSESFYKECIKEEIKLKNGFPESNRAMYRILQRIEKDAEEESLDSDDEEQEVDLAVRMANVDLEDADAIWEKLTQDEKKGFMELLQKGDVYNILPPWVPWWRLKEEKLIEEINDSTHENIIELCPRVLEGIPLFDKLFKKPPSECVKFNLINILSAYAYMVHYFVGDHHNFTIEAVNTLLYLSNNFRIGNNYISAEDAIESVLLEATAHQWLSGSKEFHLAVKSSVRDIIQGPSTEDRNFYILSALSDIYKLIERAKSVKGKLKEENRNFAKKFCDNSLFSFPPISKSRLNSFLKKIEYYLSWTKAFATEKFAFQ